MTKLESSYELCAKICSSSGSNFVSAFRFLPPTERRAMEAVYAFMRLADDLVDSERSLSERTEHLDKFQNAFCEKCLSGDSLDSDLEYFSAIFPALEDVMRKFAIPCEYFLETIRGVRMDLERSYYETVTELEIYSYRVAATVGLICLHIWGVSPEEIRPGAKSETFLAAVACGNALQWTNFLRDIVEDARNGRLYLPLEDWKSEKNDNSPHSKTTAKEILRAISQKDMEKLLPILQVNLARTEILYRKSRILLARIPRENRRIFFLITGVYHKIFQKIQKNPMQIFEKRVKLGKLEKLWLYIHSFFC